MKTEPGQGMDGMHTYRRVTRLPQRTHPRIRPLNKHKQMASTKTLLLWSAVHSIQPKPRPDNRALQPDIVASKQFMSLIHFNFLKSHFFSPHHGNELGHPWHSSMTAAPVTYTWTLTVGYWPHSCWQSSSKSHGHNRLVATRSRGERTNNAEWGWLLVCYSY